MISTTVVKDPTSPTGWARCYLMPVTVVENTMKPENLNSTVSARDAILWCESALESLRRVEPSSEVTFMMVLGPDGRVGCVVAMNEPAPEGE